MPDLSALLWPGSVAVIGASPDQTIIRGRIMHILGCHRFPGKIYPISRSHDTIDGLKAYKSVTDVPERVDLAILVIPASNVPDALEECGAAGVRGALIISSGFAEETGEAGDALQHRIRATAEKYDMAVCGPNSEGFANMFAPLGATFSPTMNDPNTPPVTEARSDGFIGVTGQSGGIGFSFYDRGRPKELPFSYVITTGNEACLAGLDFVDYMLDDDRTEVIAMFMEDVKDPAKFPLVAEKALRAGKPMIVAKVGRSEAGTRAAASHTAAMTGSFSAYQAMFQRYGIVEGRDIEECVDIAAGFSHFRNKLPKGKRVGIVTGSGGGGGWMADTCFAAGLDVPELDAETRATIDVHLPAFGTSQNPVDGTAQAIRRVGYGNFAAMVARSPVVDTVVIVTSARNAAGYEREQDDLIRAVRESEKPMLFCSYTLAGPGATALLNAAGYPVYTNMRNCARTVDAMAEYRAFRERFLQAPRIDTKKRKPPAKVRHMLAKTGPVLCEYEAKQLLAAYGIPLADGRLAESADAAVAAAKTAKGPVVLKVQSPDILHKTEAGGVALDLEGADAVRAAYGDLLSNARAHKPDAMIHGVLVEPLAPPGREIILGVNRDDAFGPMLMVGLGGVYVEVLKDTAFAPTPLGAEEARDALHRLKGIKLLEGVRGEPPADIDALVDVMVRLSRFAADWADSIAEIDLNPVLVHPEGQGVSVVDALIVKRDDSS
jgi:acyl-CoA synthetase (NDP forming)